MALQKFPGREHPDIILPAGSAAFLANHPQERFIRVLVRAVRLQTEHMFIDPPQKDTCEPDCPADHRLTRNDKSICLTYVLFLTVKRQMEGLGDEVAEYLKEHKDDLAPFEDGWQEYFP